MTKSQQKLFLQEAVHIGDQLLRQAERNSQGLSWKTKEIINNTAQWNISESLYSGTCGIIVFLLEIYNVTNDKKYLKAAKDGMQWVEAFCNRTPTEDYSFITGRMGVAYTYLKFYTTVKEKEYLTKALEIAKLSESFLSSHSKAYDLLTGTAGTLLVLIHIHAAAKESWLLELISAYINDFIKNANLAKTGIYWDTFPSFTHPLCGFSHGTSGVGFVFLELGHYFQNKAFFDIAKLAFAYEDSLYDRTINNWPDFRLNMTSEKAIKLFEDSYSNGDFRVFNQRADITAWCHGAAGIGLSRIRAYQLLHDESYNTDITRAIRKVRSTILPSFTLCHGNGGNAELLLESHQSFQKKQYAKAAESIAVAAIEQKTALGQYTSSLKVATDSSEDLSLFNGIAGIGYFLLRVNNPEKTPSVLLPKVAIQNTKRITSKLFPYITITASEIRTVLIQNAFPQTVSAVHYYAPEQLQAYVNESHKAQAVKKHFILFVKKTLSTLSSEQQLQIRYVFDFELLKQSMADKNNNSALLFIKNRLEQKTADRLLEITDDKLLRSRFVFNKNYVLVSMGDKNFVLQPTVHGVDEIPINRFSFKLLTAFKKQHSVGDIVTAFSKQFAIDEHEIQERLVAQIRDALYFTFLLPAE